VGQRDQSRDKWEGMWRRLGCGGLKLGLGSNVKDRVRGKGEIRMDGKSLGWRKGSLEED